MVYRHGDVILTAVEAVPEGAVKVEGPAVLAYGEVTGHSHQILEREKVELFRATDNLLYIKVLEPVDVTHEEHKAITLPPGIYRSWQQREYSPEAVRRIID